MSAGESAASGVVANLLTALMSDTRTTMLLENTSSNATKLMKRTTLRAMKVTGKRGLVLKSSARALTPTCTGVHYVYSNTDAKIIQKTCYSYQESSKVTVSQHQIYGMHQAEDTDGLGKRYTQ